MAAAVATAERVAAEALADFAAAVRGGDEQEAAVAERAVLVVIARLLAELRDLYSLFGCVDPDVAAMN